MPFSNTSGDVFFNVPFDAPYEPLYLAIISGLVGLGLNPRSVLEVPPDRDRLTRLMSLIRACPYSIHDLSRVELAPVGAKVPRFNMPFEAGLCIAFALLSRAKTPHQYRVFESEPYRLQQSLSDLNGYDPWIHDGKPEKMLDGLANYFQHLKYAPVADRDSLTDIYSELRKYRRTGLSGQDIYHGRTFGMLVTFARGVVERTTAAKTKAARRGTKPRRRP